MGVNMVNDKELERGLKDQTEQAQSGRKQNKTEVKNWAWQIEQKTGANKIKIKYV